MPVESLEEVIGVGVRALRGLWLRAGVVGRLLRLRRFRIVEGRGAWLSGELRLA